MRICYIGEIQSVIDNLRNLGAEITFFVSDEKIDGYIITEPTTMEKLTLLNNNVPIIAKGLPNHYYTNVNVLVLDEDDIALFYKMHNLNTRQECKDKLKELKIHYLVIALTKKQLEEHINYNLPKAKLENVNITNEQVTTAKDNLTALVGYIYIKEGTLSTEAINKANVGAALSVAGFADENLKDYYLDIKFKKD